MLDLGSAWKIEAFVLDEFFEELLTLIKVVIPMKNKRTKAKVLKTNRSWNLKEIKYLITFLRLGEWALFGVFITPKTFNLKENKFVKFVNYQKRLLEKKKKNKNRTKTKTEHNMYNNCLFLVIVLSVRI